MFGVQSGAMRAQAARTRRLAAVLALAAMAACGDPGSSVPAADNASTTTTLGAQSTVGCIGRKSDFTGEQPVGPGSVTTADALKSQTTPDVMGHLRSARISPTTEVFGGYSTSEVLVAVFGVTQLPDGTYYLSSAETCVGYHSMMFPSSNG